METGLQESDFVPPTGLKRKLDSHTLGPVCPICAKALGPSTSNQDLNDHVDWCLNKDAISQASKRTPKKAKRQRVEGVGDEGESGKKRADPNGKEGRGSKQQEKGSMMSWLSKR